MVSRYMYNMKLEISKRGQISGEINIPVLQVFSSSLVHIYINYNKKLHSTILMLL